MLGVGAEWEAEGDVVECVRFGRIRGLGVRNGDFDLWGHDVVAIVVSSGCGLYAQVIFYLLPGAYGGRLVNMTCSGSLDGAFVTAEQSNQSEFHKIGVLD